MKNGGSNIVKFSNFKSVLMSRFLGKKFSSGPVQIMRWWNALLESDLEAYLNPHCLSRIVADECPVNGQCVCVWRWRLNRGWKENLWASSSRFSSVFSSFYVRKELIWEILFRNHSLELLKRLPEYNISFHRKILGIFSKEIIIIFFYTNFYFRL